MSRVMPYERLSEGQVKLPIETAVQQDHCHSLYSDPEPKVKAKRKVIVACVLCLLFMIAEIVGGVLSGSLAIMTDAAHLLADLASFLISLLSLYIASSPATKRMNFGWHRAEMVGALVSVLLVWLVTGILVYLAIQRVISRDYEIDAKIMLIMAGLGLGINLIMLLSLHQSKHGHSHDSVKGHSQGDNDAHSHGHDDDIVSNGNEVPLGPTKKHLSYGSLSSDQRLASKTLPASDSSLDSSLMRGSLQRHASESSLSAVGPINPKSPTTPLHVGSEEAKEEPCSSDHPKAKRNINVRAAFIHVLGDVIQSVGVLAAACVIFFKPDWKLADPICTFIFSVLVLFTTVQILKDVMVVLMEGAPSDLRYVEVVESLRGLREVVNVHDLRIWSLTMDRIALSVHLAIDTLVVRPAEVLDAANRLLTKQFGISEMTIQVENYVEEMRNCTRCQQPLN